MTATKTMTATALPVLKDWQKQLQEAEASISSVQNSRYALKLHLMPPVGWLNDPNGLCQKDGITHIFFQYSPFDAAGGDKFWGHYTTRDFIRYQYLGAPLCPDTAYDRDGVYSGCAFAEEDNIRLYYTGNVREPGTDGILIGREANTLLVETADGISFSPKQCLMTNRDYPPYLSCHVRDPKVWKEENTYYMIQGARSRDDLGCVLLFTSADGTDWQYLRSLTVDSPFGYMWECPDLFPLSGKQFLSLCPQGLACEPVRYQNLYQSGYFTLLGDYREDCRLTDFREWDMGFDFYAPQTFTDDQGRRLLIGWMGMPEEYSNPTLTDGWQHALTLPRELTLSPCGVIRQNPAEELKALRKRILSPVPNPPSKEGQASHENLSHQENLPLQESLMLCESLLHYENLQLYELLLTNISARLHISISEELLLDWQADTGLFTLSFARKAGCGRTIRRAVVKQLDSLQLIADTSAIELYLNQGETVFTTRFFPGQEKQTLTIDCPEAAATLWELSPVLLDFGTPSHT